MPPSDKAIRDAVNANATHVELPLPTIDPQRCLDALARLMSSFGIPSSMIEEK
jgi:hypothetical protein